MSGQGTGCKEEKSRTAGEWEGKGGGSGLLRGGWKPGEDHREVSR